MKKVSLVTLILLIALVMTSCGKDSKEVSSNGEKVFKIGISQLSEHPSLDDTRKGFEDGLKELGVNAEIDYRNAQGDIPTSSAIAQKFVKDKVDLIFAIATPAAQSAKQATSNIPILFSAVTDPVKSEIVDDMKNVGGNITGTSDAVSIASQLKMFKEIDSDIKTIGILYNTSETNSEIQIEEVKKLAPEAGLKVVTVGITNVNELPQGIDSIVKKVDALYLITDNTVASSIELVSKSLIENKMVSVSSFAAAVDDGILATNGLDYYELGKQTAEMAKKILVDKEDLSSIPVGTADKTVIKVNKKTLKALGLDLNLKVFKNAVIVDK